MESSGGGGAVWNGERIPVEEHAEWRAVWSRGLYGIEGSVG